MDVEVLHALVEVTPPRQKTMCTQVLLLHGVLSLRLGASPLLARALCLRELAMDLIEFYLTTELLHQYVSASGLAPHMKDVPYDIFQKS